MLVERGEEIALISDLVSADVPSWVKVVLVEGSAGAGKTELLRELVERAGVRHLVASGANVERAMPLGVMCQLVDSTTVGVDLVDTASIRHQLVGTGPDVTDEMCPNVGAMAGQLIGALSRLATEEPVLVAVDDADAADYASVNCLLRLAKLSGKRLTMVLAVSTHSPVTHPLLQSEPVGSKSWRRLLLRRLSKSGVAQLLAQHLDATAAEESAAGYYRATGGNPRLVRGLIEDRLALTAGGQEPLSGPHFQHAVATCLSRLDEHVADVAEAAAVLAWSDSLASASPKLLARMVDVDIETVHAALAALDIIGITEHHGRAFRHPAGPAAVVARASRQRRVALHRLAARQLRYTDSAVSPVSVAAHLAAAGDTSGPMAVDFLVRAAKALTSAKDLDQATRYLELALAGVNDERERAGIRMTLARTEMRVDPASARRHVGPLLDAFKNDQLDDRDSATLLSHLVWHDRLEDAANVIDWAACGNVSHAVHEFTSYCQLLTTTHPDLVRRFEQPPQSAVPDVPPVSPEVSLRATAAGLRRQVLTVGWNGGTADAAVRVLSNLKLGDDTVDIAVAALEALVFSGNVATAGTFCSQLLAEAVGRDVPLWAGLLGSVRAEIAMRHGHLVTVKSYAADALSAIPEHGWGVAAGGALAAMIKATIRLDELEDAARHLRLPLPTGMFESRFGAQYLYSRGEYYIAVGQLDSALIDFQFCGRLLREWEMDAPAFVPWRGGLAMTRLMMNDEAEAERLLAEQLELLGEGPGSCPRSRGMSLLLLSLARTGSRRMDVQREAMKLLRNAGDLYMLSRAMVALSKSHAAAGEQDKARALKQSATKLSRTVRHGPQDSVGSTSSPVRTADEASTRSTVKSRAGLSESELRVAMLAATGHANREIASLLYVTVSTVEQHLTSVYRKLDVKRRVDLPIDLLID